MNPKGQDWPVWVVQIERRLTRLEVLVVVLLAAHGLPYLYALLAP